MYFWNPLMKTQGESLFYRDGAYVEVPSLVKLRGIILLKACGLRDQAWPRFYLTLGEFIKVLIYPKHGSKGPSVAKILFNP